MRFFLKALRKHHASGFFAPAGIAGLIACEAVEEISRYVEVVGKAIRDVSKDIRQ